MNIDQLILDIKQKVLPRTNGRLPVNRQLTFTKVLGYNLGYAIHKCGGYNKIRQLLGTMPIKRVDGYWADWANVELEIKTQFPDMIAKGICPSYNQLCAARISPNVIAKTHGGLPEIAEKLGCKLPSLYKCRDGHYAESIYECVFDEYLYSRGIEHGIHPSIDGRYFADFKVGSTLVEIWGFRVDDQSKIGKPYNVRRAKKNAAYAAIGVQPLEIEGHDFFKTALQNLSVVESQLDIMFRDLGFCVVRVRDFNADIIAAACMTWSETVVREAIEVMIADSGKFPSYKEMQKTRIHSAVSRFGGVTHFRRLMGHTNVDDHRSLHTEWTDELVLERLRLSIESHGRCLKQKEMLKLDVNLLAGLNACGGLEKFKMMLGCQKVKPRSYWTEVKVIEGMKKLGRIPSQRELRAIDGSLSSAFEKFGGVGYFRDKIEGVA